MIAEHLFTAPSIAPLTADERDVLTKIMQRLDRTIADLQAKRNVFEELVRTFDSPAPAAPPPAEPPKKRRKRGPLPVVRSAPAKDSSEPTAKNPITRDMQDAAISEAIAAVKSPFSIRIVRGFLEEKHPQILASFKPSQLSNHLGYLARKGTVKAAGRDHDGFTVLYTR